MPPHLLPSSWIESGSQERLYFPDVDVQTGHTLVHYLYTETYETPATGSERIKLKAALLVFIATSNHNLTGLKHLASREIDAQGLDLNLFEVLDIIDDDFTHLCPNSWVHKYLHQKARIAFCIDDRVFTNEAFLQDLNNTALIKFMTRCIVNLYNTRLTHMIDTEKGLQDLQKSSSHDLSPKPDDPKLEQIATLDIPAADELTVEHCCGPDAVSSDDFSTISCPPSEAPACETEPCPYGPTAEESCETTQDSPRVTSSELCEATVEAWSDTEPVPETYVELEAEVLDVECEPTIGPVAEESAAAPSECFDVPIECVEVTTECAIYEEEVINDWPCPLQGQHVLRGDGWKHCMRCRAVVERLATQVL